MEIPYSRVLYSYGLPQLSKRGRLREQDNPITKEQASGVPEAKLQSGSILVNKTKYAQNYSNVMIVNLNEERYWTVTGVSGQKRRKATGTCMYREECGS